MGRVKIKHSQSVLGLVFVLTIILLVPSGGQACPIPQAYTGLGISSLTEPIPRSGNQTMLVILADFPDAHGVYTQTSWYNQFFGVWPTGSFADFYTETSYGQLNYSGAVLGISGGSGVINQNVAAYVRLPHNRNYYSNGDQGRTISSFPQSLTGIYYHAIQALDAVNFDFSPYVNNTNNTLENVVVIFAGRSSVETGNLNDLQPTSYSLAPHFAGGYTTNDGYIANNFTFCPEQDSSGQASIGVCVHEHGHSLGMPDLYDFSYTTSGDGYYSLMAYGVYTDPNAEYPSHFGPYDKSYFGWITPTEVAAGTQEFDLDPFETSGQALKVLPSSASSDEYFLIENRQHLGFDAPMSSSRGLCPGILIWHVDQGVMDSYRVASTVNTLSTSGGPNHQGLVVVEADNHFDLINSPISYGECADTWAVGDSFNSGSSPSSALWNGSASGVAVSVLSESGGTVRVRVTRADAASRFTIRIRSRQPHLLRGKVLQAGSPVSGETVELLKRQRGTGNFVVTSSTSTNSVGKYVFSSIPGGRYKTRVGTDESAVVRVAR